MKKHHLISIIALSGILFSCEKGTKPNDKNEQEEKTTQDVSMNELMQEYNALKDSADAHWANLDSINDEIVITMNRLLDEISYNAKHDASRLKQLRENIAELKAQKLKKSQLAVKDKIDMYDNAVTKTANDVIALAETTPDMMDKYPLSSSLIDEINELNNNSIAVIRSDYDDHAFYFNKFVKANGEQLKGVGIDLTPFPTFSEIIIEDLEGPKEIDWSDEDSSASEPIDIQM